MKQMKWSLLATTGLTMRIEYLFFLSLLALLVVTTTTPSVFASTGMSNCREEPDDPDCFDQPDRVGNDHSNDEDVTNDEDADRDGPGGEDDTPDVEDDEGEANCWGKVTSSLTQNEDEQPGIGEHSSDPVQTEGDDNNETPREGVGNQAEGHPSDHADQVGGLADDVPECVD
jgi:hypothetical protein